MKQKITDLKVEQVPCKKEGFKEFKITYKYKGKEITDFKAYDTQLFPDTLDHEFYRMAVREVNKRNASGKLVWYARCYSLKI